MEGYLEGATCSFSLTQKHASGMTFQHYVQPQHCVKVVEPHEDNLDVLNAFAWAPVRHLEICVGLCRAALRSYRVQEANLAC